MPERHYLAKPGRPLSVPEIAANLGVYPIEAFEFVQRGLQYTATRVHGNVATKPNYHVTGQQLSQGLREFAQMQWGYLAAAVLHKWNIRSTYDFGRIVFALIDGGVLQKTSEDSIEDFRNVFELSILESAYHIESKV